jgi:hypothetical protein
VAAGVAQSRSARDSTRLNYFPSTLVDPRGSRSEVKPAEPAQSCNESCSALKDTLSPLAGHCMASVPGGRRRVSNPWRYSPLLSDGVDLPCGRGDCPSWSHQAQLFSVQPAAALPSTCWMCPVRSEVGQSAIPIAVRGRLGTVASCIEWFAWTVGVPEGSQGACQKYAHHVSTVCQCATHFCPHPRITTASDADPPLVDGSINRPLYLANARTCQLPRRRAGAQASISCNGCAGL